MTNLDQLRRRVLVVDDEPLIRMNAVDMLGNAGFDAVEAGDAAEALLALEQHDDIGLLFTDINMPGTMDGLALARHIHHLRPEVRLILTSGKVSLDADQLPDCGRFLPKPYHERQFLILVREAFAL